MDNEVKIPEVTEIAEEKKASKKNPYEKKEEKTVKRYGYTNVDAFMQVYRATKKVKDSYEKKLATWNNKYGQHAESKAKPRKSIKESLKENEKKVEEIKKKQKSRSRNSKNSERE